MSAQHDVVIDDKALMQDLLAATNTVCSKTHRHRHRSCVVRNLWTGVFP